MGSLGVIPGGSSTAFGPQRRVVKAARWKRHEADLALFSAPPSTTEQLSDLQQPLEDLYDRLEKSSDPFSPDARSPSAQLLRDVWEKSKAKEVKLKLDPLVGVRRVRALLSGQSLPSVRRLSETPFCRVTHVDDKMTAKPSSRLSSPPPRHLRTIHRDHLQSCHIWKAYRQLNDLVSGAWN